jgi:hypothetical protein
MSPTGGAHLSAREKGEERGARVGRWAREGSSGAAAGLGRAVERREKRKGCWAGLCGKKRREGKRKERVGRAKIGK